MIPIVTTRELAALTGLHPNAISKAIRRGALNAVPKARKFAMNQIKIDETLMEFLSKRDLKLPDSMTQSSRTPAPVLPKTTNWPRYTHDTNKKKAAPVEQKKPEATPAQTFSLVEEPKPTSRFNELMNTVDTRTGKEGLGYELSLLKQLEEYYAGIRMERRVLKTIIITMRNNLRVL